MISRDAWLAELERLQLAHTANDEGLTTEEWAELKGCCTSAMQALLRKAHRQGKLIVGARTGTTIRGRRCQYVVYRFKTD